MTRQVRTITEWQAQIRALGVPADGNPVLTLPNSAHGRWELLAPYVGQPLSAIPKALVLLFTAEGTTGNEVAGTIRTLPLPERQVIAADEEVFL